ncbi:MAG: pyruvate kinase, partial [Acidimicrobiia bacterium]|nr:pyruvate kinase [Acidimicrobiia bacterium]
MQRKTKIIATLGPAVGSAEKVDQLVAAGADVARLNFSHGDHASHSEFIEWVRAAAAGQGRAVAIMQDVQGPRIRVGTFPGGSIELDQDATVTLEAGDGVGSSDVIYVENIEKAHLDVGTTVLLADGLITLEMVEVGGTLRAKVIEGGELKDHKGAAFPGVAVDLPAITEKDIEDLAFGMKHGVDLVAASFVSTAAHIRSIREHVEMDVPIIAKVESLVAYRNLDEILSVADGVMVARGDLGVDISLEKLPRIQKNILRRANEAGKITITATEMLESMTSSARPTRAEVTDVANAVLDGSDAVMLSAETAVGKYPMRTVRAMDLICKEAEKNPEYGRGLTGLLQD